MLDNVAGPYEIEALCKLLRTCGKTMDNSDHKHRQIEKYINVMRTHAQDHGFRLQVLVDELQEMMDNGWTPRIAQEKAKTLEEIHREFAEQQQQQQQNQRNKPNHYRDHR